MKSLLLSILIALLPLLANAQLTSTIPKSKTNDCIVNAPLWLVRHLIYTPKTKEGIIQLRDSAQTKYRFSLHQPSTGEWVYRLIDTITNRRTELLVDTTTGRIRLVLQGRAPQVIANCKYPAIIMPTRKATPLLMGLLAYGFTRGLGFADNIIWTNECDPESPLGKDARKYPLLLIKISPENDGYADMSEEERLKTNLGQAKAAYGLNHKNGAEGGLGFADKGFMVWFTSYKPENKEVPALHVFCE